MKLIGEMFFYALFAAVIGLLSVWPRLELLEPQEAIISLSLTHAGQRIEDCQVVSQEELDELAPNMRQPTNCPRERHPVFVALRSGEDVLYAGTAQPSGLWSDGKSSVYQRIVVAAGTHEIFVGLNDSGGEVAFDYEYTSLFNIPSGQNLVVRFDELNKKFVIQ